uniref:Uncharacterized protein n=1 Tax=Ascaris lumbricoides TaxID=6252 RepID=A0A9J2PYR4_ASCLU
MKNFPRLLLSLNVGKRSASVRGGREIARISCTGFMFANSCHNH